MYICECLYLIHITTSTLRIEVRDMATSRGSNKIDKFEERQCSTDEHHGECPEPISDAGWKTLFAFTTRKHIPVFCGALAFACIAAMTLPAMSVIFGLLFRNMADFQARKEPAPVFLHRASTYCIYLTSLCAVNWASNSIYFAFFLAFSELQAHSARERVFNSLLRKPVRWFDTREGGMAAFLSAIQM
jgi:ATP-binding cassette, subfamily B (MDR/TAP), member 1